MNYIGQGAMEYLLLLAAAVVVVAVVISFMIGTINPVQESGNTQTLDFTCKTLNTNSLTCGCYLCNKALGGYSEYDKLNHMATVTFCDALSTSKNNPLLMGTPKCVGKLLP